MRFKKSLKKLQKQIKKITAEVVLYFSIPFIPAYTIFIILKDSYPDYITIIISTLIFTSITAVLIKLKTRKSKAKSDTILKKVDDMDGYEFEAFNEWLFKKLGYKAEPTTLSSDQGADLIISRNYRKKTAVQAKRYSYKVNNKAVQEAVASMKYYKCKYAMVVTNNYFTKSALDLAKANNVELINREELYKMIEKALKKDNSKNTNQLMSKIKKREF